jgi:hypothetical protein
VIHSLHIVCIPKFALICVEFALEFEPPPPPEDGFMEPKTDLWRRGWIYGAVLLALSRVEVERGFVDPKTGRISLRKNDVSTLFFNSYFKDNANFLWEVEN